MQHFAFCRRQWALIHIEQQWSENAGTADGARLHERTHDTKAGGMEKGVRIERGMRLRSLTLGVSGAADVVELRKESGGAAIPGHSGRYRVTPVEYKRGESKQEDCDRVQLCAQAMCLEEMLSCRIDEGYLFYERVRRRERVDFDPALRARTAGLCLEMHRAFDAGNVPLAEKTGKCRNCSLKNICLPGLRVGDTARYWNDVWSGEGDPACGS